MTLRQRFLKMVYPIFTGYKKLMGKSTRVLENKRGTNPSTSFYSLKTPLNNGSILNFEELKGRKVLLVNTASDCGYTAQYADLEKLYEQNKDKLMIIGFPANDFKQQEKGSDEEIAQFCKTNYGITFGLAKKSTVKKDNEQNEVFSWLSDKAKNGWNDQAPTWNFSKYLVNEQGQLTNYFDPSVSPLGEEIRKAINI